MTAPRLIGALLGALAALVLLPAAASACTCAAEGSPVEHAASIIKSSDAAFIGVLEKVTYLDADAGNPFPGGDAIFRYRVRKEFAGKLPKRVSVLSGAQESACGLPANRGRRYAVGLTKKGSTYSSSLCSTTTPKLMRRAAEQLAEGKRAATGADCSA